MDTAFGERALGRFELQLETEQVGGCLFIERRPDLSDRRVKLLALTTAGLAVRTRIVQAAVTSSPLARLSPADQQRLCRLFDKCLQPDPPA